MNCPEGRVESIFEGLRQIANRISGGSSSCIIVGRLILGLYL